MKTINLKVFFIALIVMFFISINAVAQVGIGTTDPDASSMLDVKSSSKGMLIPRMTTLQRNAISTPAKGLLVFDLDSETFWFYTTSWEELVANNTLADTDNDTKIEVEKNTDEDKIRFSTANAAGDTSIERMTIDNVGVIKIGTPAGLNYTKVTADGSLSYEGTATRYDDLRVPVTSLKEKGAKFPSWDVIYKNSAGTSQGVNTYFFSASIEEELFFTVQMPHAWKEGSNIYPHVHWVSKNTGAGLVGWGLEYVWTNVNEGFPDTSIIYGESLAGGATSVTAHNHNITPLGSINGGGKTLSSMLICRIFRDATGIGTTDSFASDAGMLQFDFHFEIDSDGSNEEYTKW